MDENNDHPFPLPHSDNEEDEDDEVFEDDDDEDIGEDNDDDATAVYNETKPLTSKVGYGNLSAKPIEKKEPVEEQQYEVNPDDLQILRVLGTGHFSDVHSAFLRTRDGQQVTVAVKSFKKSFRPNLSPEQRADEYFCQLESLKDEKKIMSSMGQHPNLLRLIGAITTNVDDYRVIIEYCEYGSLERFLREKEKEGKFVSEYIITSNDDYQLIQSEYHWTIQNDSSWATDYESRREEGIVTTSDLLWFSLQIAQALDFLTNKSILHRDIALRNILLTNGFIVKVADFGLSRIIVDGTYQPLKPLAMPIAHLAPEVLQYRQFSFKSDCWAYGVVLWEIFTLGGEKPYLNECGYVDESSVGAFLLAGKRLQIPEIAPISMRKLISKLWSKEPADRPNFNSSQIPILKDLQIANPQLTALAKESMNCHTYDKLTIAEDDEWLRMTNGSQNPSGIKQISKFSKGNLMVLCCVLLLLLILVTLGIFIFAQLFPIPISKPQNKIHWSWSFNASDVYASELGHEFYGPPGSLPLLSGCGTLEWIPFLRRIQKGNLTEIPFFLEYKKGLSNVRAERSMLLITGDGRQIMQGNDFHREGFVYNNPGSSENNVWYSNSTFLTNTTSNDPLTLKIEVFVNQKLLPTNKKDCEFQNKCNNLPMATLYFNGACYVGSNTAARFSEAINKCEDLPDAAISRLAWIESEELLEYLREVLVVRKGEGKQAVPDFDSVVNQPYFIGAKQFPEQEDVRLPPDKDWFWIDNDGNPKKSFPPNYSLWTHGQPDDRNNTDERIAAVFVAQKNISDVPDNRWFHYLCEYRNEE